MLPQLILFNCWPFRVINDSILFYHVDTITHAFHSTITTFITSACKSPNGEVPTTQQKARQSILMSCKQNNLIVCAYVCLYTQSLYSTTVIGILITLNLKHLINLSGSFLHNTWNIIFIGGLQNIVMCQVTNYQLPSSPAFQYCPV